MNAYGRIPVGTRMKLRDEARRRRLGDCTEKMIKKVTLVLEFRLVSEAIYSTEEHRSKQYSL